MIIVSLTMQPLNLAHRACQSMTNIWLLGHRRWFSIEKNAVRPGPKLQLLLELQLDCAGLAILQHWQTSWSSRTCSCCRSFGYSLNLTSTFQILKMAVNVPRYFTYNFSMDKSTMSPTGKFRSHDKLWVPISMLLSSNAQIHRLSAILL